MPGSDTGRNGEKPVPEQIRETIEDSDWPELSIREVVERTGLSKDQVVAAAGSMDRLELDRAVGAVRIPEDDGGEFVDDPERELRTDGGHPPAAGGPAAPPERVRRDGRAFLTVDGPHLCDCCRRTFDDLVELAEHNCDAPGGVVVGREVA